MVKKICPDCDREIRVLTPDDDGPKDIKITNRCVWLDHKDKL